MTLKELKKKAKKAGRVTAKLNHLIKKAERAEIRKTKLKRKRIRNKTKKTGGDE